MYDKKDSPGKNPEKSAGTKSEEDNGDFLMNMKIRKYKNVQLQPMRHNFNGLRKFFL